MGIISRIRFGRLRSLTDHNNIAVGVSECKFEPFLYEGAYKDKIALSDEGSTSSFFKP